MGIHNSQRIDLYWQKDPSQGPSHIPPLHFSLQRVRSMVNYIDGQIKLGMVE